MRLLKRAEEKEISACLNSACLYSLKLIVLQKLGKILCLDNFELASMLEAL